MSIPGKKKKKKKKKRKLNDIKGPESFSVKCHLKSLKLDSEEESHYIVAS